MWLLSKKVSFLNALLGLGLAKSVPFLKALLGLGLAKFVIIYFFQFFEIQSGITQFFARQSISGMALNYSENRPLS